MLTAFVPPPGATKAAGRPTALPDALQHVPQDMHGPEYVTEVGWYVSTLSPSEVLAWVQAHPPTGAGKNGGGDGGNTGPAFDTYDVLQPAIPDTVLSARELIVTPAKASGGHTVIRIDAEVVWLPSRPADEHIPTSAAILTVTATNTLNPTMVKLPQPVTVTDPGVVKQIAVLADALPVQGNGSMHCANDAGTRVTLTFRTTSDGPVVAELVATSGGCGEVTVTIGGKKSPTLSGARAGFVAAVYKALGVTWDPRS